MENYRNNIWSLLPPVYLFTGNTQTRLLSDIFVNFQADVRCIEEKFLLLVSHFWNTRYKKQGWSSPSAGESYRRVWQFLAGKLSTKLKICSQPFTVRTSIDANVFFLFFGFKVRDISFFIAVTTSRRTNTNLIILRKVEDRISKCRTLHATLFLICSRM